MTFSLTNPPKHHHPKSHPFMRSKCFVLTHLQAYARAIATSLLKILLPRSNKTPPNSESNSSKSQCFQSLKF